jgi:hypothetical protein
MNKCKIGPYGLPKVQITPCGITNNYLAFCESLMVVFCEAADEDKVEGKLCTK